MHKNTKKIQFIVVSLFLMWVTFVYAGSCVFEDINSKGIAQAINSNQQLDLTCLMKSVDITGQSVSGILEAIGADGKFAFYLANPDDNCNDIKDFCDSCSCQAPFAQVGINPYTIKATWHSNTTGDVASCALPKILTVDWLPPTDPSFTPASGAPGTSQKLTITGRHFGNMATVKLIQGTSEIPATEVSVINQNLLTCYIHFGSNTPVGLWTVIITNNDGQSVTAIDKFFVTQQALVEIKVTPSIAHMANNSVRQFTAIGLYADGSVQDITHLVDWNSSDSTVVTINDSVSPGLASATSLGAVDITATLLGVASQSATLTVTNETLRSILISPPDLIIAKGNVKQFTAIGTYSDNSTQDVMPLVVWSSSDTNVATIDDPINPGLVTTLSTGVINITATLGLVSDTVILKVIDGPTVDNILKSCSANKPIVFSTIDFTSKFTNTSGSDLEKIKIITLPTNGTLELLGHSVVANQEIGIGDLAKLTYVPNKNWVGIDSFNWNGAIADVYSINFANIGITVSNSWLKTNTMDFLGIVAGVGVPVISAGLAFWYKHHKKGPKKRMAGSVIGIAAGPIKTTKVAGNKSITNAMMVVTKKIVKQPNSVLLKPGKTLGGVII